ncbi:MAG: hypothetical protein ACTSQU_09870 [Promethearchaeota archaeon]
MKTKFCTSCGKELEESWSACPSCGGIITESISQKISNINPFQMQNKNLYTQEHKENVRSGNKILQIDIPGILAIIFGIVSLIFGFFIGLINGQFGGVIMEIIFGILAMIFGGISLKKGEINYKALIGFLLGGFNLLIFWYYLPFVWFRF